jgi:hypothetical protein
MTSEQQLKQISEAIANAMLQQKQEDIAIGTARRTSEYVHMAIAEVLKKDMRIFIGIKSNKKGHELEKREISLFEGMEKALAKAYKFCVDHKVHEFEMKDIREFLDHNQYARFGDWVMFGGLVYKKGKAKYGLNMPRVEEFLYKGSTIPSTVWKDPVSGLLTATAWKTAKELPGLLEFLNAQGLFEARYTQAELGI